MTETSTPPEPNTSPINLLFTLIITLLAPMFLGVAMGNIGLARGAAIETVNAYRARNHADLITIAQIVAFGLAALGSLSLSMDDTISANTAIRLRANANACNRGAEQNRRALERAQAQTETQPEPETATPYQDAWNPEPETPSPGPDRFLSPAAAAFLEAESLARLQHPAFPDPTDSPADASTPEPEEPTPGRCLSSGAATVLEAESLARLQNPDPPRTAQLPPTDQPFARKDDGRGAIWAASMTRVAREIAASLPDLTGFERDEAMLQLSALTEVVSDLNRT